MTDDLLAAIRRRFRAVRPWAGLRTDRPDYLILPGQNLLPSLAGEEVLADLREGDGRELEGDPPAFAAVHSSAALVVNAFGPFRLHPERLRLAGMGGFLTARFEMKLPTGLRGTPPNLDFFVTGSEGTVAVESKFTEILGATTARFSPAYEDAVERLAEPAWRDMYRSLVRRPRRFRHLDAAQLVKHHLGMRHSLADSVGRRVLVYVYWEPVSVDALPAFRRHRDEVAEFAGDVSGSEVEFRPTTWDELWTEWSDSGSWKGIRTHVDALRARYTVRVEDSLGPAN